MFRIVFALLLLAAPASAQTVAPQAVAAVATRTQMEPSIVGAWRLVSFLTADAAGVFKPVWEEPTGLIVYTADGQMAAQLYDAKRPKIGPLAIVSPLAAEQPSFRGLYTYFGTFTLDPAKQTVMHHVQGAMAPDWVGSTMEREYRFLTPDRLELRARNDPSGKPAVGASLLVWERSKP